MITEKQTKALNDIIKSSKRAVFFGGAGVSTESGIPDFRSADGIYMMNYRYPPEEILSHMFFMQHTEEFYEFYRKHLCSKGVEPNAAHLKLAELERSGKLDAVVTQNIDGLHQAAGSRCVWELHGSVHRNICQRCGTVYSACQMVSRELEDEEGIPRCPACGGRIKPDVVLYEEPLDQDVIEGAVRAIASADVLVVGGTSLVVYPAAGLLQYFQGDTLVIVNRDPTPQDARADVLISCDIAQAFAF